MQSCASWIIHDNLVHLQSAIAMRYQPLKAALRKPVINPGGE